MSLDIENRADLLAYLRNQKYIGTGEEPQISVLSGGVSNRTVLIERAGGEAWVMKQALAKLRVKADWFSSPERIHREAMGLRWLSRLAPQGTITPLVFEDHEHHLLAMEAVPQPHENWKSMLLRGELSVDHAVQFGRLLGKVHRESRAQRGELEAAFADTSFFESLRLEPYYSYSASQVPAASEFLNALIAETRASRSTVVHGDYSPKNVLVRGGKLILLDHEVIHWGDPAFDIGFSLTHFLSKANYLHAHRIAFAGMAHTYWNSYADTSFEGRAVRHTLGCLLARVAGRSPLEYLDPGQRAIQQNAVLKMIAHPPPRVPQLIEGFIACL